MKPIRILIADDSETIRIFLAELFSNEPDMEVVGIAKDGKQAVMLAKQIKPDIITMDMEMPVMDGIEATRIIMHSQPTPIILVVSSFSRRETQSTFSALDAGALHAMAKPDATLPKEKFLAQCQRLLDYIRAMADVKVIHHKLPASNKNKTPPVKSRQSKRQFELITIGSSVGGPQAWQVIARGLPADFPLPIVVVQHISDGFINGFVEWLQSYTHLSVRCAKNDELLLPGNIYFAPDSCHLQVYKKEGFIYTHFDYSAPINGFKPSIAPMFHSANLICKDKLLAGLLSGMGADGVPEFMQIHEDKGETFIQDEESTIVFGMAGKALSIGAVNTVVPLQEMAAYLVKLCMK